MVYVSSP